jgi:membrane fusion protein (multidrug efflux system)
MRSLPALRHFAWIAGVLALAGCGESREAPHAAPPPAVGVASVAFEDVTPARTFNGRVEAVDVVELRARVEGFVEKRLFEEGADVRAGDLLIVLEKGGYRARVGEVQGQITAAEGTLRLAAVERDRQATLVKRQVAAQASLDQAQAQYEQALGDLQRLRAVLERAELDLSYTDIKAPIDGRIGRFAFSVGDFVSPASGGLAVIVSQDPMYVTFPVSARVVREVRQDAAARGRDPRDVNVKLRLPDGSIYRETGAIDFVDVRVDPTTDTVTVRARVANVPDDTPGRALFHDQLVGVIIEESEPVRALVIPQAAIALDQAGPYVLVVDEESRAQQRRIRTGSQRGRDVVIADGLAEGERVVVEGLQKVRPGQQVAPQPLASGTRQP